MSEGDATAENQRPQPSPMVWPVLGPTMKAHHHSHVESSHHVGECDIFCRQGDRMHRHRLPQPDYRAEAFGSSVDYRVPR